MAIIYTNNSSGAIRKARRRKPTKSYLEALAKHIKYLKKLGFDCDDNGRIKLTTDGRYTIDPQEFVSNVAQVPGKLVTFIGNEVEKTKEYQANSWAEMKTKWPFTMFKGKENESQD